MNILRTLFLARQGITRVVPLMRDERVPLKLKLLAAALALFILSPLNVLGDIPLLGFFDDAALLLLLSTWFVNQASKQVEKPVVPAPGTDVATR
ncbi:MAG TPA: hypothetical protein VIG51_11690 [Candidatus Baltobacteraceae bacterium]|jgi:uncharacterized membrane protein YkvA (DUF1232 family)